MGEKPDMSTPKRKNAIACRLAIKALVDELERPALNADIGYCELAITFVTRICRAKPPRWLN